MKEIEIKKMKEIKLEERLWNPGEEQEIGKRDLTSRHQISRPRQFDSCYQY